MDEGIRSELTERQRYWLGHLQRCQAQGVSIKAYAREQGLKVSTLYGWTRKLKQRGAWAGDETVAFAQVRLAVEPAARGRYRLAFPGGCHLEWDGPVDEAAIIRLLRAWEVGR
jgi:hypothetical protein